MTPNFEVCRHCQSCFVTKLTMYPNGECVLSSYGGKAAQSDERPVYRDKFFHGESRPLEEQMRQSTFYCSAGGAGKFCKFSAEHAVSQSEEK